MKFSEALEFKKLVTFIPNKKEPIHNWYYFKEGFSKQLVDIFIDQFELTKDSLVLDPFCGVGTTLLSCKQRGIKSIGFDVSPFFVFVSKVKTRFYTKDDIDKIEQLIPKIINVSDSSKRSSIPKLSIIDKAFNKEILDILLKIQYKITKINNEKHRDFLTLGWLSVLEDVSNTYKEGNGIKYKFTKRTKKGYIKIPQKEWENKNFGKNKSQYVINILKKKYSQMINDAKYNKYEINCIIYSNILNLVITGDDIGLINIYNIQKNITGTCVCKKHTNTITSLILLEPYPILLSNSSNGKCIIWSCYNNENNNNTIPSE